MKNLVLHSQDNIHGTKVSYSDIMETIGNISPEIQNKVYTHEESNSPAKPVAAETLAEVHQEAEVPLQVDEESPVEEEPKGEEDQEDWAQPKGHNENYHSAGMKGRKP